MKTRQLRQGTYKRRIEQEFQILIYATKSVAVLRREVHGMKNIEKDCMIIETTSPFPSSPVPCAVLK